MAESISTAAAEKSAVAPALNLVSVVIPAWNEAETMAELVGRVRTTLEPLARATEIIVVVPSPDDPTAAVPNHRQSCLRCHPLPHHHCLVRRLCLASIQPAT